jgi:aromatic ring-opening dioxygenase LigB subunit
LALLREFRLYLADLDLREKLTILKLKHVQDLKYKEGLKDIPKEYEWIENSLLRTSIADHRKHSLDLLLAPFFINVKKFHLNESYSIMLNWIMSCNDVMMLHPNIKYFEKRVRSAIKNSNHNKILPIKRENIQRKYPDWYWDFKSWKLF